MASFAAASSPYKLGLDLDDEPPRKPGASQPFPAEKEMEEDVVLDTPPDSPVRVLKRLKKGPRVQGATAAVLSTSGSPGFNCLDEDIEEFSSQENSPIKDIPMSKQNNSALSSKLSLHGRRILTPQSAGNFKLSNGMPLSNTRSTINSEINRNKVMLPKLTISPLRKVQFMDSDTDLTSPNEEIKNDCKEYHYIYGEDDGKSDLYQKERGHSYTETTVQGQIRTNDIFAVESSGGNLRNDIFNKKCVDNDTNVLSPPKDLKQGNKEINSLPCSSLALSIDPETNNYKKSPTIRPQTIQMIDSYFSSSEESGEDNKYNDKGGETKDSIESKSYEKEIWHENTPTQCHTKAKVLADKNLSGCLWKDTYSKKSVNFETPVLDEFCKEYFSSLKDPCASQREDGDKSISNSTRQKGNQTDMLLYTCNPSVQDSRGIPKNLDNRRKLQEETQPPAYQYFFHNDTRIQKLVRERFVNFVPLGTQPHGANQDCEAEVVDFMYQFGPGGASIRIPGVGDHAPKKRPRNNKKNQISANSEETLPFSGGWVNPRTCMSHPKGSGTKRSCKGGQSSGHWYTGQDGRKVYVNKNGQELTGRVAYQQYSKESGGRSKKKISRRKTKAKR